MKDKRLNTCMIPLIWNSRIGKINLKLKKKHSGWLGRGALTGKEHRVTEGVWVTKMHPFVKTHQIIPLRSAYFIDVNFISKGKSTLSKYEAPAADTQVEMFRVRCTNVCNLL